MSVNASRAHPTCIEFCPLDPCLSVDLDPPPPDLDPESWFTLRFLDRRDLSPEEPLIAVGMPRLFLRVMGSEEKRSSMAMSSVLEVESVKGAVGRAMP